MDLLWRESCGSHTAVMLADEIRLELTVTPLTRGGCEITIRRADSLQRDLVNLTLTLTPGRARQRAAKLASLFIQEL